MNQKFSASSKNLGFLTVSIQNYSICSEFINFLIVSIFVIPPQALIGREIFLQFPLKFHGTVYTVQMTASVGVIHQLRFHNKILKIPLVFQNF